MRRDPQIMMSTVSGLRVLVPVGEAQERIHGMITLNDTGAFLWERLETETTTETLVQALMSEYEVSEEQAREDVTAFLRSLSDRGCLVGGIS